MKGKNLARVTHTLQELNVLYSTTGKNLTLVAADTTNKEEVAMSDRIMVIANNTGGSAYTVTVNSTALNGRLGDITAHSIAALGITMFGPFPSSGWSTVGGKLEFEASNAAIKFAVVKVP
jgi:hypothetical protein